MLDGGDRDLADTAFAAAFDAEPTDPQILWDRGRHPCRLGRDAAADALLRRIAEGQWQPRFQGLANQAKRAESGVIDRLQEAKDQTSPPVSDPFAPCGRVMDGGEG